MRIYKNHTQVLIMTLILVLFLGVVLSQARVYAEPVQLTTQAAIEKALTNNFDLLNYEFTLKKLSIAKFSSWNVFVPTVSLSATLRHSNANLPATATNPDPPEWGLSRNITVSTPLFAKLAQNFIDMLVPLKNYQSGKISFQELVANTVVSVQKTYLDLNIARETLKLRKDQLTLNQQKAKDSEQAYKSGLLTEYALLTSQFEAVKSQQQVNDQSQIYKQLEEQFALMLGYTVETEFDLVDPIRSLDSSSVNQWLENQSIQDNFSVQKLLIDEKVLKLNRLKAIFSYFPTFTLNWNTGYTFLKDPTKDSWVDDSYSTWGGDTGALSLTLALSVSEFHPWSKTSVTLRQLEEDIKANTLNKVKTNITVSQQIATKQRSLQQAINALEVQKNQINIAERARALAEAAYDGGLSNRTNYYQAESNLFDARVTYLTSQANILKNILDLSSLTGSRNPSLQKNTNTQ